MREMQLRYAGTCRTCSVELPAGSRASYDSASKTVSCLTCMNETSEVITGVAGASAQREFDRRKSSRETRIRESHPILGGAILALSDEPQSTRAWATGARGEELLGQRLDTLVAGGVRVLHDRRIPRTKANIDHIAIGPSGVFVIDAKRYVGRPSLRVEGGIIRPRVEKLMVGSRDCTKLVGDVLKQVALVIAAVPDVPVLGMLCFVGADWPLLGGDFAIGGVRVLWPRRAAEQVTKPGELDASTIEHIHRTLAATFPPA
jgi:hypothetical protein